MSTCRCGRPTRDEAYVCDDCTRSLSVVLAEVPWLEVELETSMTRAKGVDYRTKGGTQATETPSPVSWAVSEARDHLKALLVTWVLFCDAERVRSQSPDRGLPRDTLTAVSRWLMWRVDGLALLETGADAVDEITSAAAHCRRLIDRPADRMYAGRCGSVDEDTTCQVDLYAKVGARLLVCRSCGTEWNVADRREWLLKEAEEVLATAVEISRAVSWLGAEPLTADRVRQWAARERLLVRGHDRYGKALYRVGDVIDLVAGGETRRTVIVA
jgi:hypothetical protein